MNRAMKSEGKKDSPLLPDHFLPILFNYSFYQGGKQQVMKLGGSKRSYEDEDESQHPAAKRAAPEVDAEVEAEVRGRGG